MVNVFDDPRYAIRYEQANLDLGDIYGQFANTLIGLMGLADNSRILDLGSGTGISASKLFLTDRAISVVGVDRSQTFLDIARLKFGQADNLDFHLELIKGDNPYQPRVEGYSTVNDLEGHLKEEIRINKRFRKRITFHKLDASEIHKVAEEGFDYVLASQVFHWFRNEGAKPEQPNLEYERGVLQQVRNSLKQNGLFGFNTTGHDFKYDNKGMNDMHLMEHPFYRVFMESIRTRLGSPQTKERKYAFDHQEIERIMRENGFKIEGTDQKVITFDSKTLFEFCLTGGHMTVFQKWGVESKMEEREKILREAIKYALTKTSPDVKPVIETGVHYVVRKR